MRRNRRKIGTKLQFGMQIALSTAVSLTPQVSSSLSTLNKGRDSSKTPREHQEDPLLTDLQNATIKELMTKAQLAMEEFQSRNKKAIAVEDIVGKVATRIKQLLSTGNIMVQHDPFIASLVWGSFNLLLQVVINDYETMTKLAEMINNYMEASKTYHSYWKIYEHSQLKSAQHVLQILRLLEKDFRCFTYAARRYYFTRNSMVRIARSAVENFSVEFQPITDEIKDRVDRLERAVQAAKLDEDRRLKVLNWLSTLPYQDAHKAATHKWTKGTCNWIANKDEFKEWNCIPSPAVLWVHGHVGLGKTILMSRVVEHLLDTAPSCTAKQIVSYLYCRHDNPESLRSTVILATILKQIVSNLPEVPDIIMVRFHNHDIHGSPSTTHSLMNLESMFKEIITLNGGYTMYVLLDGLDECSYETRREVCSVLTGLNQCRGSAPGALLKVAVFSRSQEDIRRALRLHDMLYEILIQTTETVPEIRAFVAEKLKSNLALHSLLESRDCGELSGQIIETLVSKSNGMFLWASIQLEAIFCEIDVHSIVHCIKHELPSSIDINATYKRILERVHCQSSNNKKLAMNALSWALHSRRALSVEELTDVFRFVGLCSEGKSPSELQQHIVHVCHGLIQTERQGEEVLLRFVHYSAKEFASREHLGMGHLQIAKVCMQYLQQQQFDQEPLGSDTLHGCQLAFNALIAANPFFKYAAEFWDAHVTLTTPDSELSTSILSLFTQHERAALLAFQVYWFQVSSERFPTGSTGLHVASYFGVVEAVEGLALMKGQELATDKKGRTAVHWAAKNGNDVLQLLLGQSNVQCLDKLRAEALLGAIDGGRMGILQDLLDKGADPNIHTRSDTDPLFLAAARGNLQAVKLLIAHGAVFDSPKAYGSPLQVAAQVGATSIVEYLLTLCEACSRTIKETAVAALEAACLGGHLEAVQQLVTSNSIRLTHQQYDALIELAAVIPGDNEIVTLLMEYADALTKPRPPEPEPIPTQDVNVITAQSQPASSSRFRSTSAAARARLLRIGAREVIKIIGSGNITLAESILQRGEAGLVAMFDNPGSYFNQEVMEYFMPSVPQLLDDLLEQVPSARIVKLLHRSLRNLILHGVTHTYSGQQRELIEIVKLVLGLAMAKSMSPKYAWIFTQCISEDERLCLSAVVESKEDEVQAHLKSAIAFLDAALHSNAMGGVITRSNTKILLACIDAMEKKIAGAGVATFKSCFGEVRLDGLLAQTKGIAKRETIMFIEICYGVLAHELNYLVGYIRIQLLKCERYIRTKEESEVDQIIKEHIWILLREKGGPSLTWDADREGWWSAYPVTDLNPYFALFPGYS